MPLVMAHEEPSVAIAKTQADRFRSNAISLFTQGVREGFSFTSGNAAIRFANFKIDDGSDKLDEDAWRDSEHFREGLDWFEGMNLKQADILARAKDKRDRRDFIFAHADSNSKAFMLRMAGGFVGSIPDPLNFIGLAGLGTTLAGIRTFQIGRQAARAIGAVKRAIPGGVIAERTLLSSAEAGLAVGLAQPLIFAAEGVEQGDYDMKMAALNISFALGIGGAIGTASGAIRRMKLLPEQQKMVAMSKGMADVLAEEPVNVASVFKSKINIRPLVQKILQDKDVAYDLTNPVLQTVKQQLGLTEITPLDILRIMVKPETTRSKWESIIAESLDIVPEVKQAAELFFRTENLRPGKGSVSAADRKFLKEFLDMSEDEFIERQVANTNKQIKQSDKRIAEINKELLKREAKLSDKRVGHIKRKTVQGEIDALEKELRKLPRSKTASRKVRKELFELRAMLKDIDRDKELLRNANIKAGIKGDPLKGLADTADPKLFKEARALRKNLDAELQINQRFRDIAEDALARAEHQELRHDIPPTDKGLEPVKVKESKTAPGTDDISENQAVVKTLQEELGVSAEGQKEISGRVIQVTGKIEKSKTGKSFHTFDAETGEKVRVGAKKAEEMIQAEKEGSPVTQIDRKGLTKEVKEILTESEQIKKDILLTEKDANSFFFDMINCLTKGTLPKA